MKFCEIRKTNRKWRKKDTKRNSHHRSKGRHERAKVVVIETNFRGNYTREDG